MGRCIDIFDGMQIYIYMYIYIYIQLHLQKMPMIHFLFEIYMCSARHSFASARNKVMFRKHHVALCLLLLLVSAADPTAELRPVPRHSNEAAARVIKNFQTCWFAGLAFAADRVLLLLRAADTPVLIASNQVVASFCVINDITALSFRFWLLTIYLVTSVQALPPAIAIPSETSSVLPRLS